MCSAQKFIQILISKSAKKPQFQNIHNSFFTFVLITILYKKENEWSCKGFQNTFGRLRIWKS